MVNRLGLGVGLGGVVNRLGWGCRLVGVVNRLGWGVGLGGETIRHVRAALVVRRFATYRNCRSEARPDGPNVGGAAAGITSWVMKPGSRRRGKSTPKLLFVSSGLKEPVADSFEAFGVVCDAAFEVKRPGIRGGSSP